MMRRFFTKKHIVLASAALALTASLTVGSAMAYFTTYANAKGGCKIEMGFSETIPHETVDEKGKHVTIENIGENACFVRAKVFAVVDLDYAAGEGWMNKDGYWCYTPVLNPGESTTELNVTYTFPADEDTSSFDVVVVQECTPVLYKEDGTPYADWNRVITSKVND